MAPSPDPGLPPLGPRRSQWPKGTLIAILVVAALLFTARLAAPWVVRRAIVRRLDQIPTYSGQVGSISLRLWRGAYRINEIRIFKSNGRIADPFFSADRVDFSIAWSEILRGRLVSQITVKNGRLNFLRGANEDSSQLSADRRWQGVIDDLFPIDITDLDIEGGVLRFVDAMRDGHYEGYVKPFIDHLNFSNLNDEHKSFDHPP
jgi:uncharacterized protein involved in outer membrane biogenesis